MAAPKLSSATTAKALAHQASLADGRTKGGKRTKAFASRAISRLAGSRSGSRSSGS